MYTTLSLPVKRPRDPPPFLGGALGGAVLLLSLLAVALPILGATYLGHARDSSAVTSSVKPREPADAAPAASPAPQVNPDPAQSSDAAPVVPRLADTATAPSQSTAAAPAASAALAANLPAPVVSPSPPPDATAPRHGVMTGMDSVVDIPFASGSAKLPNDHRGELTEIASLYRKHGGMVRIVGYGEAGNGKDATDQSTFGLALDRAKAVAIALSQLGVSPGDLRVEAAPLQSVPSGNIPGAGAEVFIIRS